MANTSFSINAFKDTRDMFLLAFEGIQFPMDFDTWLSLDDDLKAAALYINFYKNITYAWYNFEKYNISDDIAVSVVVEKLIKNVPLIINAGFDDNGNPKMYRSCYIKCISWNAIGDEMRRKVHRDAQFNELFDPEGSDVDDDMQFSFFDLIPAKTDSYETIQNREALWDIIHHMGPKAEKVVNHLLNNSTLNKLRKNSPDYEYDELRDVSVSPDEYDYILSQLRKNIEPLGYAFAV